MTEDPKDRPDSADSPDPELASEVQEGMDADPNFQSSLPLSHGATNSASITVEEEMINVTDMCSRPGDDEADPDIQSTDQRGNTPNPPGGNEPDPGLRSNYDKGA